MPKLEVDGVGVISFPVPEPQVRQLMQHAERAPYGRGEETILDTSVRKVWQLPPAKLHLGGKSWAGSFQSLLERVAEGLGCEAATVSAQLYKMLVYDKGAFFAAHRDTEKADGMFSTLVVVLPSTHRGGELVIRHAGHEVTVDLSAAEVSHQMIERHGLDMTHVTERKGSPQTLVCTKTRNTYQWQCAQYKADIHSFGELVKALPTAPDVCPGLASRMAETHRGAEDWSPSK
jgi:hypothetical protein